MRGHDSEPGGRRRLSSEHPLLRARRAPARPAAPAPAPAGPPAADGADAGDAADAAPAAPRLDGEGRRYITLAQFLKHHDLAPTGGAAKHLARSGAATVNGQPEDRPGRKLHAGDTVVVAGATLVVEIT